MTASVPSCQLFVTFRQQPGHPHQPHHLTSTLDPPRPFNLQTVLDGEMVVDEVLQEGRSERRFLAYDIAALNGMPLVDRPFMVGATTWRGEGWDCRAN